jgi:hypothetical protein
VALIWHAARRSRDAHFRFGLVQHRQRLTAAPQCLVVLTQQAAVPADAVERVRLADPVLCATDELVGLLRVAQRIGVVALRLGHHREYQMGAGLTDGFAESAMQLGRLPQVIGRLLEVLADGR